MKITVTITRILPWDHYTDDEDNLLNDEDIKLYLLDDPNNFVFDATDEEIKIEIER